jgi:hypothetical protein
MKTEKGNKGIALAWKQMKKERAIIRNTAWVALTPTEKLESLDKRLGKGIGAKHQRAKLMDAVANVVNIGLTKE